MTLTTLGIAAILAGTALVLIAVVEPVGQWLMSARRGAARVPARDATKARRPQTTI